MPVSVGRAPGSGRGARWAEDDVAELGGHLHEKLIEPAKATEIAPIIVQAYDLTDREQQITRLIARGARTAEIAGELYLSAHTVRDHVKAIFAKVGVSSRGELVARLFADHHEPVHLQDAVRVSGS